MFQQQFISHCLILTNYQPDSSAGEVARLCYDALTWRFLGVSVNPTHVKFAKGLLKGLNIPVGTTVGFTLGQDILEVKIKTIEFAIKNGADELDIYPNLANIKVNEVASFAKEVLTLNETAKLLHPKIVTRMVLEPGLFEAPEMKVAARLIRASGANFIQVGSDFGPRPPTFEDVRLIRGVVGDKIAIKVAGDIRTLEQVHGFMNAGVEQVGTSRAVRISQEERNLLKSPLSYAL